MWSPYFDLGDYRKLKTVGGIGDWGDARSPTRRTKKEKKKKDREVTRKWPRGKSPNLDRNGDLHEIRELNWEQGE